jgi:hypothetical protein
VKLNSRNLSLRARASRSKESAEPPATAIAIAIAKICSFFRQHMLLTVVIPCPLPGEPGTLGSGPSGLARFLPNELGLTLQGT